QSDETGKVRAAEIPPAAANDEDQKGEEQDRAAEEPAQASPHRSSPLTLARGSVVMLLSRAFVYRHSDSLSDVLTTSQKIEIAQVITGRDHGQCFADRRRYDVRV